MDTKLMDSYLVIEKAFSAGIIDDAEILEILKEQCHHNESGAVLALSSYYDNKQKIKEYIKKNDLAADKSQIQMGE